MSDEHPPLTAKTLKGFSALIFNVAHDGARQAFCLLLGEVWRLRAKVRYQARRISDLETEIPRALTEAVDGAVDTARAAAREERDELRARALAAEVKLTEVSDLIRDIARAAGCGVSPEDDAEKLLGRIENRLDDHPGHPAAVLSLLKDLGAMANDWSGRHIPAEKCTDELITWIHKKREEAQS